MWRVASMGCSTRLSSGPGMPLTELQVRVNWLSGEKPETVLDDFPPAVEPLFARPDLEALLAHMPECDEWGILPTWAGPPFLVDRPMPPPPADPVPASPVRLDSGTEVEASSPRNGESRHRAPRLAGFRLPPPDLSRPPEGNSSF